MKKMILFAFLLSFQVVCSQSDTFSEVQWFDFSKKGVINISPLQNNFGKNNIVIDDDNIKISGYLGSPLLFDTWVNGTVLFRDGKKYELPNMNYDAVEDHFIVYIKNLDKNIGDIANKDFPLIGLNDDSIIFVSIREDNGFRNFVKILPEHFNMKPKTVFFEYYSDKPEKAYVLKSYFKKIGDNKLKDVPNSNSLEEYAFIKYQKYYIKNKDGLYISKNSLSKKKIFQILNDRSKEKDLKKFIKNRKLKMSRPKDVQLLLSYYYDTLSKK